MAAPYDWVVAKNDETSDAPAFGLARITGIQDETGAYILKKPNQTSQGNLAVIGETSIVAGQYGKATIGFRHVVAYDPTSGIPANGDDVGSQAGSWLAHRGQTGFKCLGGSVGPLTNLLRTPPAGGGGVGTGRFLGQWASAVDTPGPITPPTVDNTWTYTGQHLGFPVGFFKDIPVMVSVHVSAFLQNGMASIVGKSSIWIKLMYDYGPFTNNEMSSASIACTCAGVSGSAIFGAGTGHCNVFYPSFSLYEGNVGPTDTLDIKVYALREAPFDAANGQVWGGITMLGNYSAPSGGYPQNISWFESVIDP
jgi:hypothetical protein